MSESSTPKSSVPFRFSILDRVTLKEKINFTRHLSVVVKAGLPVFEGLKIIERQAESKTLKMIISQLIIGVNSGHTLADSLSDYRNLFGDFFISVVAVGEASGSLTTNLAYLAEELEKSRDLQSKIRSAMLYPIIILIATLGVVALLTFAVFPKVIPVLEGLQVKMPVPTIVLMASMRFLTTYGWQLALALFVLWLILKFIVHKVPAVRYILDRIILSTPIVGTLTRNINVVNITRVMGILLKSGIRIVEAVTITSQTMSNLVYRRALEKGAAEVQRGETLAKVFGENRLLFSPLMAGLIEVGENTGNLEENLGYLSEYYEKEVDLTTRNLTTVLEPLMLLIMGLLVGFVALAIILPIYQATSSFRG